MCGVAGACLSYPFSPALFRIYIRSRHQSSCWARVMHAYMRDMPCCTGLLAPDAYFYDSFMTLHGIRSPSKYIPNGMIKIKTAARYLLVIVRCGASRQQELTLLEGISDAGLVIAQRMITVLRSSALPAHAGVPSTLDLYTSSMSPAPVTAATASVQVRGCTAASQSLFHRDGGHPPPPGHPVRL